jgi:hypothetical protein
MVVSELSELFGVRPQTILTINYNYMRTINRGFCRFAWNILG